MPRVRGWTTAQLIAREEAFDALISKAIRMTLRPITLNMNSIIVASTISEFASGAVTATWDTYVVNELHPYLVETFMDSAVDVLGGMETALDVSIPKITEGYAQEYLASAPNRLKNIGDAVWVKVRASLMEGVDAGEDMQQLASRVRHVAQVPHVRASVIARTEVHAAAEQGALAQVQLGGFTDAECQKEWLATDDARTRPEHLEADGQRVGLNQSFIVWGEGLRFPGDPNGRAENVIQCRCSTAFVFDDDDEDDDDDDDEPLVSSDSFLRQGHTIIVERDQVGRFSKSAEIGAQKINSQRLKDDMLLAKAKDNLIPLDPEIEDALTEVYTFEHGGLRTGDISVHWGHYKLGRITVSGTIFDKRGRDVGDFERGIDLNADGTLSVVHEELLLNSNVQGQGFAEGFNNQAFSWYRSIGVDRVSLLANSDVGGYAWARAGYDWKDDDPSNLLEIQERINRARQGALTMPNGVLSRIDKIPPERREEQLALAQQLWLEVGGTVTDDTSSDEFRDIKDMWPIPFDLSQLGRWEGAGKDDWWIGKIIMLGSNWWGVRRP